MVAPAGTVVVMLVAVLVRITEGVPLNWTDVALRRFVPKIVTDAPIPPNPGLTLVIAGEFGLKQLIAARNPAFTVDELELNTRVNAPSELVARTEVGKFDPEKEPSNEAELFVPL